MEAKVGDRLVVNSRHVGQPAQTGEITEIIGIGGQHFRVRWSDGRESVVFPGSDATIEPKDGDAGPSGETRTVSIDLRLVEDSKHCEATATMRTSAETFTGLGRARRHPQDPVVPMIGEELAVARSLADLAAKLEAAASQAIRDRETQPLHLVP